LARRHGLRGYDAVQLAAALEVHANVPSLTLLSADANLDTAATGEGLLVDDPKEVDGRDFVQSTTSTVSERIHRSPMLDP
jgi:hypothetical protein